MKGQAQNSLQKVGLLIVGVPLVFQLTCMGILGWLLHAQMDEMQRHYHVRLMQENMSAMLKSSLDTGLSIAKYKWKGNPEYLKQFDEQLAGAKAAMAAMEQEGKPNEREYIQRVHADFDQLMQFAEQARHDVETESRLEAIGSSIQLKKSGGKIINALQADVQDFEAELLTSASEDPRTLAHHTVKIAMLIFAAAIGSCVMAFLIHRTFSRNITGRLRILTDNTFRLARSEMLHAADKGGDAIGHLDRVFHDMANALAEAARKERAVVQHALDVICSIDADGFFTAVSPASNSVWGFAPEELIGTSLYALIAQEGLEEARTAMQRIRDNEVDPQPFENKVVRKDGNVVYILWSAYWATSEQSMFCVAHDITERKMAERLKREFVSTVSHELRTPLTAIRGSLTLLAVGALGKMGDQAERAVKIAERNCLRLIDLINDLLDIEKLEAGKLEMVFEDAPIDTVMERSLEAVRGYAEQYGVRIETQAHDAHIYCDADRLVQVLVNLLSNAIKFSPRDGVVSVAITKFESFARIDVIDTGRGIPPEFIDKVFERFEQVETLDSKKKGGTGLGLAICRAIVEQHNGRIGVESTVGKGSRFWFEIPLVKVEARPAVLLALQATDPPLTINVTENSKVAEERN